VKYGEKDIKYLEPPLDWLEQAGKKLLECFPSLITSEVFINMALLSSPPKQQPQLKVLKHLFTTQSSKLSPRYL